MTERLYYGDARCVRFVARLTERADDGRRVYLDRSAFYPTSGGQPHDVGTLGGVDVVDVVDEGARVAHLLAVPLPGDAGAPGALVDGVVDWHRRWDHMQQHTGQHLLSAIAADQYGWETVSVHFGAQTSTIDFGTEVIAPDVQRALERQANALAAENRPVVVSFEDAATAAGLRKPSGRDGVLRIVSIEGLDRSACGGTHVATTGEIGAITLRRVEKVRQATRVEFLCGARAVARARADYDLVSTLAQGLSCGIDELVTVVPSLAEQLKAADAHRRKMEGELAGYAARERYAALVPNAAGLRRLAERRRGGKADDVRPFALAFVSLGGAVYASAVESPPSILLATSEDSGIDAGRALKEVLGAVGGRGGGGPRLAQGTVPDAMALDAVLRSLGFVA